MNRLKELRKQKGLTQQGLADEISVSKITVLRWENEERQIKPEKAQQLADFFGVSVGYLLGYSEHRELEKALDKTIFSNYPDVDTFLTQEIKELIGERTKDLCDFFGNFYPKGEPHNKKEVLEVVTTQRFGSKHFDVYGDIQNPLFVAVEVAEMIEIQNTTDLLKRVDDDEKLTYVISRAGQKREMNMLTEFGVYEVLSQSRKPLAKEFKKVVKHILKEIRLNGYYMDGELVEEPQTTIKAPDTLAEAERYYIDTLAKAIAEAQNMDEKSRLTSKLTRFMQEVEPQWN